MKKSRISSSTCLLGPRSITCEKTLCDGYGMSSTLYGRLLRYSTQIASSVIHTDRKRMRWWVEAVSLSNDAFTWKDENIRKIFRFLSTRRTLKRLFILNLSFVLLYMGGVTPCQKQNVFHHPV